MSSKNITMTKKLKMQTVDLMRFMAVSRLTDEENPDYVKLDDRFDIEQDNINKIIRSVTDTNFSFLMDYLKLTSKEKSQIEKTHRHTVETSLNQSRCHMTPAEEELYIKNMKSLFDYELSAGL